MAFGHIVPTTSSEDFFIKLKRTSNQKIIQGILLYTNEDKILKEYIQEHFQEFHKLSGHWCQIFVLEKPSHQWIAKNLSSGEELEFKSINKVEIDKSEAYDIARELMIDFNKMPCLVLFGEDYYLQKLIIPIEEVSAKYFRNIFTKIEKIIYNVCTEMNKLASMSPFEAISYHFDDIINYLDKHAKKIDLQNQYLYQEITIYSQQLLIDDNSINTSETFNNNNQGANFANFANQVKDNARQQANQYNIGEKQNLAQAASEIQQLLRKLQIDNPTSTDTDRAIIAAKAADAIKNNPTLKARVIGALKSGGKEALKEAVDNPIFNVSVAMIEGWQEAQ
ncbi:hypothetical protein CAL7716_057100 [Calothrix sp. PCC 7716]|nr:hypothetical protein CAL7716_057100 [Calothrix sp. PCC 7716]